jgi:hypothetical protein
MDRSSACGRIDVGAFELVPSLLLPPMYLIVSAILLIAEGEYSRVTRAHIKRIPYRGQIHLNIPPVEVVPEIKPAVPPVEVSQTITHALGAAAIAEYISDTKRNPRDEMKPIGSN